MLLRSGIAWTCRFADDPRRGLCPRQAENSPVAQSPVEDDGDDDVDDDDDDDWGMDENPLEKPVAFDNGENADSSRWVSWRIRFACLTPRDGTPWP